MATPIKNEKIDCFICFSKNVTTYKLDGRKLKTENFISKLKKVIDADSAQLLLSNKSLDPGVCRNCYSKICNFSEFSTKATTSIQSFVSLGAASSKRGILSPLTPKSGHNHINLNIDNTSTTTVLRSRKQLKLFEDIPPKDTQKHLHVPVSETILNSHPEDHCYNVPVKESSYQKQKGNEDQSITTLKKHFEIQKLSNIPHTVFLQQLRSQCFSLTSKTAPFASVLSYRGPDQLIANDHLIHDIISEMENRVPFLLQVLLAVAVPNSEKINDTLVPAIASCYSILMKQKSQHLTVYHKMASCIATEGGLDDMGQTRFNHLGITLSSQRRLKFQESIRETHENLIVDHLKSNPIIKITGDNLDQYVKASNLTAASRNKDLHLFTSNLIFPRVSTIDIPNEPPRIDVDELQPENILLPSESVQRERLKYSYTILLARILCKMPPFQKFKKLIPDHIPHEYTRKMATASKVFPLPIMFKNEAKHEDCLAIMDTYENQLMSLYNKAYGDSELLRKFKCVIGGDQLTRCRLQEAKNLRTLSVTPERRLDDLYPIICELWHVKQDFLEKCFKRFYKNKMTPGTLYHFKTVLHRSNVNGTVKGRFRPHHDFLMMVGETIVTEMFMEFFNMESLESKPNTDIVDTDENNDELKEKLFSLIYSFINHYGLCAADVRNNSPNDLKPKTFQLISVNQQVHLVPQIPERDGLFNYSLQLCHWYLHILQMNDTAKEGDLNRCLINLKYSLPFFFSHSNLSKYLVECIDYILKCEHLLSPLQRIRILEGSFTNCRGGTGYNVESDLVQEHSVCNQKQLIKSLGANKTEQSIARVTSSADAIRTICNNFDASVLIKTKSGRHGNAISSEADYMRMYKELRKLKPFHHTPGRVCDGFDLWHTPLKSDNFDGMKLRIKQIITRLTRGFTVAVEEEEIDNDNYISDNLPPL